MACGVGDVGDVTTTRDVGHVSAPDSPTFMSVTILTLVSFCPVFWLCATLPLAAMPPYLLVPFHPSSTPECLHSRRVIRWLTACDSQHSRHNTRSDCLHVIVTDSGDYEIDLDAITLEIYVYMDGAGSVTFKGLVSHNNALTIVGDGDGSVHFPALRDQGVSPVLLATEADVTFDVLDTPDVSITCAGDGHFRFPALKTLTNKLLVQEGEVELPSLERAEATIEVSAGVDKEAKLTLGSASGSRWVEQKEGREQMQRCGSFSDSSLPAHPNSVVPFPV